MHSLVMFYYVYVIDFDSRNSEMNSLESPVKSGGCSQTCPAGPPGPPGLHGEPGKNGTDGAKGNDGSPGRDGKDGRIGPPGIPGQFGMAGPKGANGSPGKTGSQGPPGTKGVNGLNGKKGEPGSRGSTGPTGEKGDRGLNGSTGPPGQNGLPGSNGRNGQKGDRGDRGLSGSTGQKGDRGLQGIPGLKGQCITRETPGWCYLDRFYQETKSKKYTYFFETLPSTKKNIIVIECPSSSKTFTQSIFLCSSLCGRMLLPSSKSENDEVFSILGRNNVKSNFWIRFSDAGKEESWRDIENNAVVNFTNWKSNQPSASKDFDYATFDLSLGKWYSNPDTSRSVVVCELPR